MDFHHERVTTLSNILVNENNKQLFSQKRFIENVCLGTKYASGSSKNIMKKKDTRTTLLASFWCLYC